jgi:uncharacterized protein with PIN domain
LISVAKSTGRIIVSETPIGDCFSYALARDKRDPILFKGDDFVHTDLRSAVEEQ